MPNSPIFVKVGSTSSSVSQYFTPTSGQTTFAWAASPTLSATCQVLRDGLEMRAGSSYDYTVSGNNVVFNTAPWGGIGDAGWVLIRQ
jgi:hypothetical protein